MAGLAQVLVLLVQFTALLTDQLVLVVCLLEVCLQFKVPPLKSAHSPLRILFNLSELLPGSCNLNISFLKLILSLLQLLIQLGSLSLVLIQFIKSVIQTLKDPDLDELLERHLVFRLGF